MKTKNYSSVSVKRLFFALFLLLALLVSQAQPVFAAAPAKVFAAAPAPVKAALPGGALAKSFQQVSVCDTQSQIPASECSALASLYSATNGAGWNNRAGWLVSNTPCSWYGVSCAAGHVTQLALNSNGLNGALPAELGSLPNLTRLSLTNNPSLSGSIPAALGSLSALQILQLSKNQLSGSLPTELGSLTALQTLDVSTNALSGAIPASFGNLTNLARWLASNNQLSGSLPASLGSLNKLQSLNLAGNQLSGAIPAELGNLTSATAISLAENQLSGSIPAALGSLPNLQTLQLYNNHLTGSIPPELGSLANLKTLELYGNQLSGPIPSELGNLSNAVFMIIGHNQFTGSPPASLGNLVNLQHLSLVDNNLTGPVPLSYTNLTNMALFRFYSTSLCEPADPAFQAWKATFSSQNWLGTASCYGKASPANGQSVSPAGLTLSWGAMNPAVLYEYCVDTTNDNACSTSWVSAGTNTSATVSGLSLNTTYYWQVRAKDKLANPRYIQPDNDVWWSFNTGAPASGAFGKTAPANGASAQPLNPTLTWGSSDPGVSYEYCLSTSGAACPGDNWTAVGANTSAALSGLSYATTYSWQVRARNNQNELTPADSGAWWTFTTLQAPPAAFGKTAPANNAAGVVTNPTLSWAASTPGASYEYCLSTSGAACPGENWTAAGANTSVALGNLSYSTTYYWQARAVNGGGTTPADSGAWWSFTTLPQPPLVFSKTAPANNAANQPTALSLTWNSAGSGFTYEYCLSTSPALTCATWTPTAATSAPVSGLANAATYYWQVRAIDGGNPPVYANAQDATPVWQFSTRPAPPSSSDVTYNDIPEDQPLSGSLPGANQMTFTLFGPAPAGSLTLSPSGAFTYQPPLDFFGQVTFQFTVSDGINDPVGPYTVTIHYTPVNDAPVARDDAYPVETDALLSVAAPGVLANDSDVDSPTLTAALVSGTAHGALTLNPSGAFTYMPANGFSGVDTFTYRASDGQATSNIAVVTLTVASADRIFADGFESGNLAAWSASLTDGGDLSASAAAALTGSYGMQAVINDNNSIFVSDNTPAAEKHYRARFYFDTNNLTMATSDRFMLFSGFNAGGTQVFTFETRRAANGIFGLRAYSSNDSGAPAGSPWIQISDDVHYLEIEWQAASAPNANNGRFNWWIDGIAQPALSGLDNDTLAVSQIRLGAVSGIDPATRGTLFFDDFVSTRENYIGPAASMNVNFSAAPLAGSPPLAVTFTNQTTPDDPANAYQWNFGDGATSTLKNPQHTYTAAGTYTVTLSVSGPAGSGSLTRSNLITLQAPPAAFGKTAPANNAAGVVTNPTLSWAASSPGASYEYCLSTSGAACPGENWTAAGANTSVALGNLSYSTTYYWQARAVNGGGTTPADSGAWWSFTTLPQPPLVFSKTAPANNAANQPTALSLTWNSAGSGFTYEYCLSTSPALTCATWTPTAATSAPVSGLANAATYYWQVRAIDGGNPPVYANAQDATPVWQFSTRPAPPSSSDVTYNDIPEDQPLSGSLPGANQMTFTLFGPAPAGSLTLSPSGAFTYQPPLDFFGQVTFQFTVSDGINDPVGPYTVTIHYTPVNDAPVARDDAYPVETDALLSVAAPGVLANDSDVDSPTLTAALVSGTAHGALTLSANGAFTYQPANGFTGADSFTYRASDGQATSNIAVVTLTVASADRIFADGFESGNLAAWSASLTDGGDLSASAAAALTGSYGMQAVINDNNSIFVSDNTPAAEKHYRARFYFDPNNLTMATADRFMLFSGFNAGGTQVFTFETRRAANGVFGLRAYSSNDSGAPAGSPWIQISDDVHYLEIDWQAASAPNANNGRLNWWIDGIAQPALSGLDNDTLAVSQIRLGAVSGIDPATRGTLFFDDFVSTRENYIGPAQ